MTDADNPGHPPGNLLIPGRTLLPEPPAPANTAVKQFHTITVRYEDEYVRVSVDQFPWSASFVIIYHLSVRRLS